jgi:hypothetical protein
MGAPLTQIPEFFPTEFNNNWEHAVQQKQSRLKGYATHSPVRGKEKKFNIFGKQTMTRKTARAGQTNRTDVALSDYWLRPLPYDLANLVDEYDEEYLGEVVLPTSEMMQSHVAAYMRQCDHVIIDALGGTKYTGEFGTTAVALPSTQKVAVDYKGPGVVAANVGLNLAKLIEAKSILGRNEVTEDGEEIICAYSQKQLDDLLYAVDEVSNADYNNIKALVAGDVDRFMGMKFVRLEGLPLATSTDIRRIYVYVKSGIKFADSNRRSHMDILPAESHALQIRTTASLGASRTQEEKVVEIACDQSP